MIATESVFFKLGSHIISIRTGKLRQNLVFIKLALSVYVIDVHKGMRMVHFQAYDKGLDDLRTDDLDFDEFRLQGF